MTTMSTADVLIVGAGIGGLTAALALHARGIDATIMEGARAIRLRGAGINVQPQAIGELIGLGFGDELAATGIATREHRYVDSMGSVLWTEPRGVAAGHPYPQYSVHRGELQMMLLNAVRDRLGGNAVRDGTRVTGIGQSADGVSVSATTGDGDAVFRAAALIGADGVHSVVRRQLHPDRGELLYGGAHMWRGLTALDEPFLDGRTMILANDQNGVRLIAYPVSARRATEGKALLNWVCLVPTQDADASEPSAWGHPTGVGEVLPSYADWSLGWLDVRRLVTHSEQILRYPMVDREPLDTWGEGRVTLLGDAAHLMYPIGANGGSQAIVDAVTLADELARHGGSVSTALRRYEDVRRPATTAIVRANRAMDRSERGLATRGGGDVAGALEEVTRTYRAAVAGGDTERETSRRAESSASRSSPTGRQSL